MTDTTAFLNLCITATQKFNQTYEDLKSISDRIGADSALSTNTATAASKTGRSELVAADFDNLKTVIDLLTTLLNASNGGNVPVTINTGGTVKLGFYKIL
jgi:hypothetical protein